MAKDETRAGTWTTAHNFELRGDRLYSSWYQGGVRLHDVSDPANPEQLAWWRRPEETLFWTARAAVPGEYFVASSHGDLGFEGQLMIFPDRAGEQSDPPDGVYPPVEMAAAINGGSAASTRTETAVEEGAAENDDDGESGDGTGGQSLPGFGVAAALAGLGLGALGYRRRRHRQVVAGAEPRGEK